ncbi:hypothetical protein QJS04_geneDACA012103 [Acorus gramineus]|uniref:Uncharacterized protein n=1 Tax=Acorus gramineus TaxID=55184 RepID=A0AAV9BAJ4_ACOGR|nr:hypothetical protein QJS04_geneDACA012103 [Acorus gramineus]
MEEEGADLGAFYRTVLSCLEWRSEAQYTAVKCGGHTLSSADIQKVVDLVIVWHLSGGFNFRRKDSGPVEKIEGAKLAMINRDALAGFTVSLKWSSKAM